MMTFPTTSSIEWSLDIANFAKFDDADILYQLASLTSLRLQSNFSTPTASVKYESIYMESSDSDSTLERAKKIVSKLSEMEVKSLLGPINERTSDLDMIIYLKDDAAASEQIAINVRDFLQLVANYYSLSTSIASEEYNIISLILADGQADSAYSSCSVILSVIDSDSYSNQSSTSSTSRLYTRINDVNDTDSEKEKCWRKFGKSSIVALICAVILLIVLCGIMLYVELYRLTDCYDWRFSHGSKVSGIYQISPRGIEPFDVYCDMTTDGGGWTVFQKRQDNSLEFWNRNWTEYKNGFNNGLEKNFWLGLDRIHALSTKDSSVTMRIEVQGNRLIPSPDPSNETLYFEVLFYIDSETEKYRMHMSRKDGDYMMTGARDQILICDNQQFTTVDSDNDVFPGVNCAKESESGGWWYGACGSIKMNGAYNPPGGVNTGFSLLNYGVTKSLVVQSPVYINPLTSVIKLRKN